MTIEEPVLPDVDMHLVRPTEPVTARVMESCLCTRGGRKAAGIVRHVALDVGDTPLAGRFRVGQSFGVLAPESDNGRPQPVRLYSIASPSAGEDGEGRILSTTVKRLIAEREPQRAGDDPEDHSLFLGVTSNFLCDINVGDEVRISGPQGKRFLLPVDPAAHDYIFFATGTGIAPFRGMILELFEGRNGPTSSEVHLVMGAPYASDLLYDDLFSDLSGKHANFHYHTAISREIQPGMTRGNYAHDVMAMHFELFDDVLRRDRTLIYICGIAGMQFGIYQTLARNGLSDRYLRIADDYAGLDPEEWDFQQSKRKVKPNKRMMLEVY